MGGTQVFWENDGYFHGDGIEVTLLNVENVQAPTKMIVFLIQDKGKNSFDVAVNNPDSGTITLYQNLNKITY